LHEAGTLRSLFINAIAAQGKVTSSGRCSCLVESSIVSGDDAELNPNLALAVSTSLQGPGQCSKRPYCYCHWVYGDAQTAHVSLRLSLALGVNFKRSWAVFQSTLVLARQIWIFYGRKLIFFPSNFHPG
jgi:hypothetical protein